MPAPGGAGSLGANSIIAIDTTDPVVVDYRVLFGATSYSLIGSTRNDLPWQITGIQVVFDKPIANGDVNSLSGVVTTGFSGLGTNTLTWTISPISDGRFATALAGSGVNALTDTAGNPLDAGNGYSQNFNVLYGDATGDGSVTSADMLAVYRDMSPAAYSIFDDLNGDGTVDMSDVQIARLQDGAILPPAQLTQVSSGTSANGSLLFGGVSPQTDTTSLAAGAAGRQHHVPCECRGDGGQRQCSGPHRRHRRCQPRRPDGRFAASSDRRQPYAERRCRQLDDCGANQRKRRAQLAAVTGPGTATLSGTNSFTGGVTVSSGTLILSSVCRFARRVEFDRLRAPGRVLRAIDRRLKFDRRRLGGVGVNRNPKR